MAKKYSPDPNLIPTKVRDLREGDLVDLTDPNSHLSKEPAAEFEYGEIVEIDAEKEAPLILIDFRNIGCAAYGPDDTLYKAPSVEPEDEPDQDLAHAWRAYHSRD